MKKKLNLKVFVILMVTWLLTMVSVVAGVYIYKHKQASDYDDLAVPYIKQVIPVLSQWDPESTRQLMAPEALEGISEEMFTQVLAVFSRMGELQSIEDPSFEKVYSEEETEIDTVIAYSTDAKYANGDAVIAIQLLLRDGSFEVFRFNLSSNTLTD